MAARRGALNREAILGAAHDVISERGYHAATTAEMCRRAGVSSGTFFHYFPRKLDVVVAILTFDARSEGDVPTSLDSLLDEVVEDAARPGTAAFMREVSTLSATPEIAEALRAQDARRQGQIEEAVEQARLSGRAGQAVDPDVQATRLQWIVEGFESMVAGGADVQALAPQLREMVDAVLA